jgi:hypothetical protein
MTSSRYKSIGIGIAIALAVITAGGLTAFKINDSNRGIGTTFSYKGNSGVTALNLLEQYYKVQTKNYRGLGTEVTGINGVDANSKDYWAFYVDGKMAQVGPSSYVTKTGDSVTWKLESD